MKGTQAYFIFFFMNDSGLGLFSSWQIWVLLPDKLGRPPLYVTAVTNFLGRVRGFLLSLMRSCTMYLIHARSLWMFPRPCYTDGMYEVPTTGDTCP